MPPIVRSEVDELIEDGKGCCYGDPWVIGIPWVVHRPTGNIKHRGGTNSLFLKTWDKQPGAGGRGPIPRGWIQAP